MDTNRLRKAATAVYLVVEEAVAVDLSDVLHSAADEIDQLRAKLADQPDASDPKKVCCFNHFKLTSDICPGCGIKLHTGG